MTTTSSGGRIVGAFTLGVIRVIRQWLFVVVVVVVVVVVTLILLDFIEDLHPV